MIRLALAIVIAFAGCKSETARKANRAADELVEQRDDVVSAVNGKPDKLPAETAELAEAERVFAERKRIRIAALRGEHSVIGTQIQLISTLAESFPLTDAGRAEVNEKLSKFQMRHDEALNHIEGLDDADAAVWEERDDAVRDVMDSLDGARKSAWEALDDAPRIDPNAS